MRNLVLAAAAAAATLTAVPVAADPPSWAPAHGRRAHEAQQRYDYPAYTQYNRYNRPYQERRLTRNDYAWRGNDGRYYCRRSDGTTGLVIGGAAGALLGSQIAGRNDRTLGAILGAVGGAVLGRSVDRGDLRCR